MEAHEPVRLEDLQAVQRLLAEREGDTEVLCQALKRVRPLVLDILVAANAVAVTRYEVRDLRDAVAILGQRTIRSIYKRYLQDLKKIWVKAESA